MSSGPRGSSPWPPPVRARARFGSGTAWSTQSTIVGPSGSLNTRVLEGLPASEVFGSGPRTSSGDREVGLPQFFHIQELVRRTLLDDLAFLHDVPEVRDPKGLIGVLLDHEDR